MKSEDFEEAMKSNCEIILPSGNNDYWVYKKLTSELSEQKIRSPEKEPSATQEVTNCLNKNSPKSFIKQVMLFIVIFLIVGIGMGVTLKTLRKQKTKPTISRPTV
jgi:hypothetical protein